tara:strand:+ start:16873 stop:17667 length:795 start_codon:yes stop_codon:yes gene_type:complete
MGTYTISNQKLEIEVHKIIQYLAAAGNSFLPKKQDDSHTNLKSLTSCGCLTTRPLNKNGDVLAFSYSSFTLEWWIHAGDKIKLPLDGITHNEIVKWIVERARNNEIEKPFTAQMHYELPYKPVDDYYTFHLENKLRLTEIMHYRILAHLALEDTLENLTPHTEIRVWPHHFDIASLYTLNKQKQHVIGLGMAIPDTISKHFYLYVKGYAGEHPVTVSEISELDNGRWDSHFNGAILELDNNSTINKAHQFFKQATHLLKTESVL